MKGGAPTLPIPSFFVFLLSPYVKYPLTFIIRDENLFISSIICLEQLLSRYHRFVVVFKQTYKTSIRCVTFYTIIKTCRKKVAFISKNIRFFLNKYFLRIMVDIFHFIHFFFIGLVTCLGKDDFTSTWLIKL